MMYQKVAKNDEIIFSYYELDFHLFILHLNGWTICSMCYVYIKVFLFHSNLSSPAPKWMDHPFSLLYITLLMDVLGPCVKGQVNSA